MTIINRLLSKLLNPKFLGFLVVFGIAKLSVFSAPLLFSNIVSKVAYGKLEYALSLGAVLAVFLNAGMNASYPYFKLKKKTSDFDLTFYIHTLFIWLLVLTCFLVYKMNFINFSLFLSILVAGILAIQMLQSVICKSEKSITKAVVLDSGLFITINLMVLYFFLSAQPYQEVYLIIFFGVYGFILLIGNVKHYRLVPWQKLRNDYLTLTAFGWPTILSSFIIIALTTSGRVLVEFFLSLEDVAVYAIYFRLAAIVVIIHQVANIAFFKNIYTSNPKTLDKYFAAFIAALLLLGIISYFILPHLAMNYLVLLKTTYINSKDIYFSLAFQMPFWVAMALNENICYRENLARQMNKYLLVLLVLMILAMTLWSHIFTIDLEALIRIHILFMYFAVESQYHLFHKSRNFNFRNSKVAIRVIISIFLVLKGIQYI
ncbi:hypothetical protein QQ020_26560 [Fulvivirgaceae bacterium BMA12]|uniref:Polysaccharide biosynthesis protein n=1 Tax=Agaribacillus aureus TaxID=3051825 RepID=A0ABT8LD09_9BACT|nr:hypothetical protein [Fulvivirgaceae bacterium BMA12]